MSASQELAYIEREMDLIQPAIDLACNTIAKSEILKLAIILAKARYRIIVQIRREATRAWEEIYFKHRVLVDSLEML